MRILIAARHRPFWHRRETPPFEPRDPPSGASGQVYDLLARGLAERGHQVLYRLPARPDVPLPPGVAWVSEVPADADVLHDVASPTQPWIRTRHRHTPARARRRDVFVSQALARRHGGARWVHNGVDPDEYVFSETKDDYLLFVSAMDGPSVSGRKHRDKGLDVALGVARRAGRPLVVAGSAYRRETIADVARLCAEAGATYVGDVRGGRKAELLAGARALLFPTRVDEGFGLVIAEALMSGTPVVASDRGACPELVTSDVGMVCADEAAFLDALARLDGVSPRACREAALARFHYRTMTDGYLREYAREIAVGP